MNLPTDSGNAADVAAHRSIDVRSVRATHGPEWLLANGLGGYASGTVLGPPSRRYHGLLVAAFAAPLGRMIMLNHVRESIADAHGNAVDLLDSDCGADGPHPGLPPLAQGKERFESSSAQGKERLESSFAPARGGGPRRGELGRSFAALRDFHLELGLPVWRYEFAGVTLDKTVCMPHAQNSVHVIYRVIDGPGVMLRLRPYLKFRPLEAPVDVPIREPCVLNIEDDHYELSQGEHGPVLRVMFQPCDIELAARSTRQIFQFPLEAARGYVAQGELWSPGAFSVWLHAGAAFAFSASTESWEIFGACPAERAWSIERARRGGLVERAAPQARSGLAAELVLAADAFVITPAVSRREEVARAYAAGEDVRTIVAGYHWFTDWGRDTMVSLEGLTLVTGRERDARFILRTFAEYVHDGLVPNFFPEGGRHALYHTADATLWFFHALGRYLNVTQDWATLRHILPRLVSIFEHHVRGTRFGIGVDPADGLLREGAPGYQLTWMDAKVGDWVVTPRRGKPVEVNALWYNALRLLEQWLAHDGDKVNAPRVREHAALARDSFNRRFWYEAGGYLYDVVDGEHGDDAACRPNQIFAIALDFPVLEKARWSRVLDVVSSALLTPRGLRTLAPGDPQFQARYDGDRRARDAAYHQGTVWPWLIGAYTDAWLKAHPEDQAGAQRYLQAYSAHLSEAGVGYVSEIFDAEPPFAARGCIAQAWSVAELLRALVKTSA